MISSNKNLRLMNGWMNLLKSMAAQLMIITNEDPGNISAIKTKEDPIEINSTFKLFYQDLYNSGQSWWTSLHKKSLNLPKLTSNLRSQPYWMHPSFWGRQSEALEPVMICDTPHSISLYVDDILIFVKNLPKSPPHFLKIFEDFGNLSGYRINWTNSTQVYHRK